MSHCPDRHGVLLGALSDKAQPAGDPGPSVSPQWMQPMLAVPKSLCLHTLLPQLGFSSSMSKLALLWAKLPVIVFPAPLNTWMPEPLSVITLCRITLPAEAIPMPTPPLFVTVTWRTVPLPP